MFTILLSNYVQNQVLPSKILIFQSTLREIILQKAAKLRFFH